jgi:hypothetical protein
VVLYEIYPILASHGSSNRVLHIYFDHYLHVTCSHNLCVFSIIGVYERNLSLIIQHCVHFNINPSACEMNKDSMPCDVKMNVWCKLNPTGDLPEARTGHTALYCETDRKVSRAVEWHVVAEHFIQSFSGLLAPVSYSLITLVQELLAIGRGGVCV